MKTRGGKPIYGAAIGIMMLEAQFPRIPGDMGNATTWDFPVHYKLVRGATPDRVVRQGAEGLLDTFIAAAHELVAEGVDGITTNCGFLSLFQQQVSEAVPVPVVMSSLMQVETVNRILPAGKTRWYFDHQRFQPDPGASGLGLGAQGDADWHDRRGAGVYPRHFGQRTGTRCRTGAPGQHRCGNGDESQM